MIGNLRAEVVMCSMGTLGDVKPFLAIGRTLVARGHTVTFLTNECWLRDAHAVGMHAIPIAPQDPAQTERDDRAFFRANVLPSFRASFEYLAALVDEGKRPIVLHRTGMLGAASAAQRFNLPSLRIALQPCAIRSYDRPAWPFTTLAEGRARWARRHLLVPAAIALADRVSPYRSDVREFRRAAGLPPDHNCRLQTERLLLMLCPRWFAQPQPDWPQRLVCTGFPYARPPEPRDPSFDPTRAPVLFTSGTGVSDGKAFVDRCRHVAASSGRPALILSRTLTPGSFGPELTIRGFVDLEKILPSCAAIVHHGGIGTTSEAIRAGVPQLILADRFDQPDNGVRVAELGLGGAILRDSPDAALVAETLSQVLASGHVAAQVATAAGLVRRDDSVSRVVEVVEEVSDDVMRGAREVA